MFCPQCGNPDQAPETYCRRCGVFLPDLSQPRRREATPEENLKVNTVLTLMTVIVCFSLSISLYVFLGFRPDTHPLIYVAAGLLIAMGGWHIQTFIRTRQLKRQWSRKYRSAKVDETEDRDRSFEQTSTARLLPDADLNDVVPASVTENTTKHLDAKLRS